jgi:RNA polymerase sigma-70 factor (ECF subfamily)
MVIGAGRPQDAAGPVAHVRPQRRTGERESDRVAHLVIAAKAGDREALSELYARYAGRVRAHVLRIVGDEHAAEDITQQVFAKLLTRFDRFEPGPVPFAAWLLRVAQNAAIDHLRSARSLAYDPADKDANRNDDAAASCRSSLREALASLPAEQRDVLVLRHFVGLSPAEIAAHLGRSVRAVHGLSYRGRAAACRALNELGAAPATIDASCRCPEQRPIAVSANAA